MRYTWNNINVEQYARLISLTEEELKDSVKVVEALTGKTKNELTVKEVKNISVGDLSPKMRPDLLRIFVHEGTLYGMQDVSDMSFGLFADVTELGKDIKKHLPDLVAYLYRPVTSMSFWSLVKLRIIARWGQKVKSPRLLKILMNWMTNLKYEIEDYDPIQCDLRVRSMKKAPAAIGHHVSSFFLIWSRQLQIDFLKSSRDQMLEMKKAMQEARKVISTEGKQGLTSPDGVGIQLSGDSLAKSLPKWNQFFKRITSRS